MQSNPGPRLAEEAGALTSRLRVTQYRFLDRPGLGRALDDHAVVVRDRGLGVLQAAPCQHADDLLRAARPVLEQPRDRGRGRRLAEHAFLGGEQPEGGEYL